MNPAELVRRELDWWCEHGWRYDNRGRAARLAHDLEQRHHAQRLGRPYP